MKTELAHLEQLKLSFIEEKDFRRTDAAIGVEYAGFEDTMLGLELAGRHLYDIQDPRLDDVVQDKEWQAALRINQDFMYRRLHTLLVLTAFGALGHDVGGFARGSVAYELSDGLEVRAGAVIYLAGDLPPFNITGSNHRVFVDVKYSL